MRQVLFIAMPTGDAQALWDGGTDAYGMRPERFISDGDGNPCRHCLQTIDRGDAALLFAYRPFAELQAFAETGPIFLHEIPCRRYGTEGILPPILDSPDYIVRGYSGDDRIVYGTGAVTPVAKIAARSAELLARPDVAYVHVRSARNNCYHCRIDARQTADPPTA